MKKILFILMIFTACSYNFERDADDYAVANNLISHATRKLEEGDLEEARATFLLSNEIIESAAALDGLGCAAFLSGNLELAQSYFISSFKKDNKYYNSLGNLALLYDYVGWKNEAIKLYNIAIQGNPKNYKIRNNFAALLYDNNSRESGSRLQAKAELFKAKSLRADKTVIENLRLIQNYEHKP